MAAKSGAEKYETCLQKAEKQQGHTRRPSELLRAISQNTEITQET